MTRSSKRCPGAPGEFAVLYASGEGVPFGWCEDQCGAGGVFGVADADVPGFEPGYFDALTGRIAA